MSNGDACQSFSYRPNLVPCYPMYKQLLALLTKFFITDCRQVTKCIDSKTAVDCSILTSRSKVSAKAAAVALKCMHHNYGVISGSHARRACVWHIILDVELYTTCPGERVFVATRFNVTRAVAPFEIGAPPFHVWPPGCCIHPILYFKNVPPPFGFWPLFVVFGPPCCQILATGLNVTILPLMLCNEKTRAGFSKEAENLTTYGYALWYSQIVCIRRYSLNTTIEFYSVNEWSNFAVSVWLIACHVTMHSTFTWTRPV